MSGSVLAQMPMPHLTVLYQPITALKPDPRNPRLHDKKQVRQIARSIETFGFLVPVLVDQHNQIVCGHGRLLAAGLLGMAEVPTICAADLTSAQAKAFQIADNRLTENADWDRTLLAESFVELAALDLDFGLELTGFEMGEIDVLISELSVVANNAADPADTLPNDADGLVISQPGDLWQLGAHRLLCGNALEETSFMTLMAGEKASVVFIDPPYNVKIDGHVSGNGAIQHREFAMASGEMGQGEFTAFLTTACKRLTEHTIDGSIHFVCMDHRHMTELLAAGKEVYSELKNLCVWVKDNGGMGSFYRSQHELVFVFKHGTAPHRNNIQLGQYGRNRTNVWRYAGMNSFSRQAEESNLLDLHPTVKPVAMVADAILDCSARGDIVLDSFAGSGTTILAAERTGRRCFAMELDPAYVDTAIRRWQTLTGEAGIHAVSGQNFAARSETEVNHEQQ